MRFFLILGAAVLLIFFCLKSCGSKLPGSKDKPGEVKQASLVSLGSASPADKPAPPVMPSTLCTYRFRNRLVPPASAFAASLAASTTGAPPVAVSIDTVSNAVMLRGGLQDVSALTSVCSEMDVESGECYVDSWMVFVEGNRVEDFEAEIGFNPDGIGSLVGSVSSSGFGVAMPAGSLELKFDMMKSSGLLEVMDRPQVRLSAGEKSEVTTGQEIPYPVVQSTATGSNTGIEFKRVGLRFSCTPLFLPSNRVRLTCEAENGLIGASVKIGLIDVPSISRQSVTSTATLGYDEAMLLGGLESVRKETRFGLFGESEKIRAGRLYVALILRSGVARAVPVAPPGANLPADFTGSLLPPKGWNLKSLDAEIDRVEKSIRSKLFSPRRNK